MVVEKKCLAVSACVSSLILLLAGVGCQQGDSSQTTAASISIPKSPSAGQSIGVFGFHGATVKEGTDTMVTWFVDRATGATKRKQFAGTEFAITDYEANQSRWVADICDAQVSSVFLFGYSRGGVSALDAAHDLSKRGACGGNAPQVRWVGVVDPVGAAVPGFESHIQTKLGSAIPISAHCEFAARKDPSDVFAKLSKLIDGLLLPVAGRPRGCSRLETTQDDHQKIAQDTELLQNFINSAELFAPGTFERAQKPTLSPLKDLTLCKPNAENPSTELACLNSSCFWQFGLCVEKLL